MKAICLDATGTSSLEEGREYFVFLNGPLAFYVSRFDRPTAHFSCAKAEFFQVIHEEVIDDDPEQLNFEQLSLFNDVGPNLPEQVDTDIQEPDDDSKYVQLKVMIPEKVISPIEILGVRSKEFTQKRKLWSDYVRCIQSFHKYSWFESQNLLEEHRDIEQPIEIAIHRNSGFTPEEIIEYL
ncbi:hypothetical protein MUO14_21070 [Halobacillus shinanisalinarum]|uniref:Uncharacterized protein n=1 Tax=Halobacillus shinanisalinarum TaxID=2932258 RepID=A0ABY4GY82_9BACI|nr:hypothetical protein [Halobacillus shinanisalinarum]UOQ92868.1 hypothetical protein MUO14_21070 [Halobacillus shinanisalinarum]